MNLLKVSKERIAYDLIVSYDKEPKHPKVLEGNYLETTFGHKNYVSITNPPFGRSSSLSKEVLEVTQQIILINWYLIPRAWMKWSTKN